MCLLALQAWTNAPSIPTALVSILLRLSNVKFVIATLGEDGCLMLERTEAGIHTSGFLCHCLKFEPLGIFI